MDFTGLDIEKVLCCDAVLTSIRWVSNGRDLELNFELGDGRHGVLLCTWIDNVKMHIESGTKGSGVPMACHISVESKLEVGRWRFSIGFIGNQHFSVECEDLVLKTNERNS